MAGELDAAQIGLVEGRARPEQEPEGVRMGTSRILAST